MTTMRDERRFIAELRHDLTVLRGSWWWFVLVGGLLIVLGFVALGAFVATALATAIIIGALILAGGVAETIGAFWCRGWSGFFFHLLSGVLSIVVGMMFLRAPVGALIVVALLLACALMVSGAFKIVTALSYRFAAWGLTLFSGVLDVVPGAMIWMEIPASAFWVIGVFVGISLLFRGINWIAIGLTLRTLLNPPRA